MKTGFDLETVLAKETYGGTRPEYADIDTLRISGEGELTTRDSQFIKNNLPNLTQLDFTGFTGSFAEAAFKDCSTLRKVVLPDDARLTRELFFACTSLEEVVFPRRYTLSNDCFSYCALDFSEGYPGLISDANVLTYASNQRPLVYLTFQNGSSGTLKAGATYRDTYSLRTKSGKGYMALATSPPKWLITRPRDLEVVSVVLRDGAPVSEVDTSTPGRYEITYSLAGNIPSDVPSITYHLTVGAGTVSLNSLIAAAEGKVSGAYTTESYAALRGALGKARTAAKLDSRNTAYTSAATALNNALQGLRLNVGGVPQKPAVGTAFTLTLGVPGANNAENWKWDETYLSADFSSGATFTPLQQGATTVTYTTADGDTGEVALNIAASAATRVPAVQNTVSSAAAAGGARYFLYVVLALAMLALLALIMRTLYATRHAAAFQGPRPGATAALPAAKKNRAPFVYDAAAEEAYLRTLEWDDGTPDDEDDRPEEMFMDIDD